MNRADMTTFSYPPPKIVETLKQAIALHRAGKFADAAALYRSVLRADPHQFDALYHLGRIEMQREQFAEAERLLSRAVRINPRSAEAFSNYSCVLAALNR